MPPCSRARGHNPSSRSVISVTIRTRLISQQRDPGRDSQMQTRMKNPAVIFPEATKAVQTLLAVTRQGGVPQSTLELVHLRASQINGCSFCVNGGWRSARKAGETDERLFSVAA